MTTERKQVERGGLVIGGTTLIGLGVGFIFLSTSVFVFLASLLCGIGMGLVISALFTGRDA